MIRTLYKIIPVKLKKYLKKKLGNFNSDESVISNMNSRNFHLRNNAGKIPIGLDIGRYCNFGENVILSKKVNNPEMLATSYFQSNRDSISRIKQNNQDWMKNIIIGSDVWIGSNTVILDDIKIGDGAIIEPGTIVTNDVPPYSIVGGNPSQILGYRYERSTIDKLLDVKWWNLPNSIIEGLPLEDVNKSIEIARSINDYKSNNRNLCFVITSVIQVSKKRLNYSSSRSEYSIKERIDQTYETINSIRDKCPNAKIILVDAGIESPRSHFEQIVDEFIYCGDDKLVSLAVNSKYKGLGEISMLLKIYNNLSKYDMIFKISGRYHLTNEFRLENYDFDSFNFKNYNSNGYFPYGESRFINGSHSTRLYAFPNKYLKDYKNALYKSIFGLLQGKGIEIVLPQKLKCSKFFYHEKLGLIGNVAVDKSKIIE